MGASRMRAATQWLLLVLVCSYAPIALSAAWSAFLPGVPHLQEAIDRWLGGDRYADGWGSVSALRGTDYADHRVVMLLHIVAGAICLLLAVSQVFGTSRWHRAVGRAHLALVTVSMVCAIWFLVVTEPGPGAGQSAFRAQLWVLAASTLGTAWLAAVEAARGRARAHKAWMTLHIAFLLTAPLLRFAWMALAPVLSTRDMLTNIESGAVLLAVVAPACGVAVALRVSADEETWLRERTASGSSVRADLAIGVAGLGAVVVSATAAVEEHVWFHLVPSAVVMAGCLLSCRLSQSAGASCSTTEASWLFRASASAPWTALVVAVPTAIASGWTAGMLTGLMLAPGVPFAVALAMILARRDALRPAPEGGEISSRGSMCDACHETDTRAHGRRAPHPDRTRPAPHSFMVAGHAPGARPPA